MSFRFKKYDEPIALLLQKPENHLCHRSVQHLEPRKGICSCQESETINRLAKPTLPHARPAPLLEVRLETN